MAESSLSRLNYGHPGIVTYDLQKRGWNFARNAARKNLKQVSHHEDNPHASTQVLPPSADFHAVSPSARRTDTLAYAKDLILDHPDLAPAVTLLPDLAITSNAVLSITAIYDPLISDLFATGSIPAEDTQDTRRIAAVVDGECGNVLRLMFFYKEHQGWRDDRSIFLRGETLRDTESAFWNEEAAPIQQVCFAQSLDRSSFLALRLPTKIVIFRPVFSTRLSPASRSSCFTFPPSRIQPRPILTLDVDQSGGNAHADVMFNPDYQYQFAIVNDSQTWSIWDIDHRKRSDTYTACCLVQGSISEEPSVVGEDGWAKILWVGDVSSLVVCNRRQMTLINIAGDTFTRLPCPILFLPRSSDWILDVKKHPTAKDGFFILTSSSVFLVGVTTMTDAQDMTASEVGARIMLSWSHYRGTEDITLNMHVQVLPKAETGDEDATARSVEDDPDEVVVLLQSRLNDLIHCYRFYNDHWNSLKTVSSSDPALLELSVGGAGHITNLRIEPLHYQANGISNNPGPGLLYHRSGVNFYKLFILRSDQSVHEIILCESTNSMGMMEVETPAWTTVHRLKSSIRAAEEHELDDFIEPDGTSTSGNTFSLLPQRDQEILSSKAASHATDQSRLYHRMSVWAVEERPITTNIPAMTERLNSILLDEEDPSRAPLGTLVEYAGVNIDVPDVDEASNALDGALSSDVPNAVLEARHVASLPLLFHNGDKKTTIAHLYDTVLQHWVAPLPQEVPVRVRQAKERLARRLSAEVMLASTRIRQRQILGSDMAYQTQDGGISLPILSAQPIDSSQIRAAQFSSQALPTAPPSAMQPSLQPYSSQSTSSSMSQATPSAISSPLERLSKHLRFRDDTVDEVTIKTNVSQLLAHWQSGSDPHAYDWEATEHTVYDDNLDEASQEQKEKEGRRKARRERKQQRENELMRTQPSSQTFTFAKPVPILRSSPGPTMDRMMTSSQVPSQRYSQVPLPGSVGVGFGAADGFVAQSQVEPGRFGGRPDKKKKKKRLGGF